MVEINFPPLYKTTLHELLLFSTRTPAKKTTKRTTLVYYTEKPVLTTSTRYPVSFFHLTCASGSSLSIPFSPLLPRSIRNRCIALLLPTFTHTHTLALAGKKATIKERILIFPGVRLGRKRKLSHVQRFLFLCVYPSPKTRLTKHCIYR